MKKKKLLEIYNNERNINGIKYLIGSGFAFSLMSVCVKAIGSRIPISELVFARAVMSLIMTRILILKNSLRKKA